MSLNNTEKYPTLLRHPEIRSLTDKLKRLREETATAETSLVEKVLSAQSTCAHASTTDNMVEDASYIWGYPRRTFPFNKPRVLASKICTDCGHEEHRPNKKAWEICYKCWSPMEDIGKAENEYHVYRCTECKHTVAHT